jgi:DNA-3-methyladenine glycosylase I
MPPHASHPPDGQIRCPWCGTDALYVAYHDREWGVPLHEDNALFELLTLEGAQAGLSWLTILRRREGYRAAYAEVCGSLTPQAVARLTEADQAALMVDARIIRNRLKISASVGNAQAFLAVQESYGSFDAYLWRFVDGVPVQNALQSMGQIVATTPTSDALAKDLKARGFRFVGSTIVYAFMQSAGLVNDHLVGCFRHGEVAGLV